MSYFAEFHELGFMEYHAMIFISGSEHCNTCGLNISVSSESYNI